MATSIRSTADRDRVRSAARRRRAGYWTRHSWVAAGRLKLPHREPEPTAAISRGHGANAHHKPISEPNRNANPKSRANAYNGSDHSPHPGTDAQGHAQADPATITTADFRVADVTHQRRELRHSNDSHGGRRELQHLG
jgi:hypothetical protein